MTSIRDLTDFGVGKDALIIANGRSILNVNWNNIDRSRFVVFGINHYQQPVKPDFVIYYDSHVYGKKPSEYYRDLPEDINLIGFDLSKCDRCDYFYTSRNSHGTSEGDVIFQDSGGHMVQIADRIMNFDNIYLLGYDYHDGDGYIRFIDTVPATEEQMTRYAKAVFSRALHKYMYPHCIHADLNYCDCEKEDYYSDKIYNCTENSELTLFPYIDITEV